MKSPSYIELEEKINSLEAEIISLKLKKFPMRIALSRTSNDQLITDDNMPTHDYFSVKPDEINHELVGWNLESVDYDRVGNILTFVILDTQKPKDYL